MRLLSTLALVAVVAAFPDIARADGLIYRLPEDGASIEFEMKGSFTANGQTMEYDGTFLMSSVGKKEVDGVVCRWIEFRMALTSQGRERTVIAKVLVPEAELAAGKTPSSQIRKAWLKQGDREAREITDFSGNDAGPLPAFLSGPFSNEKKSEAAVIESGLGKLECKGVTGNIEFKQGSTDQKWTMKNRLNEKAPFGVVTSEIEIEISRNGQQTRNGSMTMKAVKVGKEAKSQIPDAD